VMDVAVIQIVCTGKGAHREVPMRKFDDLAGDWREVKPLAGRLPLQPVYTCICRRCAPMRETRLKARTLRAALDGLRAAGRETLDISRLPF
jgi:hypothetical protein